MGDLESTYLQLLTLSICDTTFTLILLKTLHLLCHISALGIFFGGWGGEGDVGRLDLREMKKPLGGDLKSCR